MYYVECDCVRVRERVCLGACMRVCMCMLVRVCVHLCSCVCTCVFVRVRAFEKGGGNDTMGVMIAYTSFK